MRDPLQPGLFEPEETPVVKPKRASDPAKAGRPRWSKYRPVNPPKCDDCMLALAQSQGRAPASRRAKFRRQAGSSDLLLCYAHAQLRREDDGLEALG